MLLFRAIAFIYTRAVYPVNCISDAARLTEAVFAHLPQSGVQSRSVVNKGESGNPIGRGLIRTDISYDRITEIALTSQDATVFEVAWVFAQRYICPPMLILLLPTASNS